MDRNKINDKYKWNLSDIYKDKDSFFADVEKVKSKINEIGKYKDIKYTGLILYDLLNLVFDTNRIIDKLSSYSSLLCDIDTGDNKNQELKEMVNNLISEYASNVYFVDTSILKMDEGELNEFYLECNKLEDYRIHLDNLRRFKKYTLSDDEEKLLANLSLMFGNNYDTYELLKDNDMEFPSFYVDGVEYKLDNSNYSIYIESDDRRVRETAFKTFYKVYKQYKNVFANLISSNVKENSCLAKVRGYDSSIFKSLYSDCIPLDVYNNLIDTVYDNLDVLYKYYKLKKEVLNVDEFHLYDVYANLVESNSFDYSFDAATEIVIKALSVLGDEYISVLTNGLNNHWIDVYPSRGKRTGGYSGGSYDTEPYILLNYQNKYDDMSTLAHELGHSMHSYYSRVNNPYQYGYYSIFVAEVASTVNELLLAKYVIKNSKDKKEKLFVVNRLMELFRATIFRQTMFSCFEKDIYERVEKGGSVTADILSDIYYALNKKFFGPDVCVDEEIRYEWTRIPHFYYNFYVYKYATGLSSATYIVNGLLDGTIKVSDYIEFLKCGSKKTPLESLKIAGVDLTKKEVIESAIKMFNDTIDEFIELNK